MLNRRTVWKTLKQEGILDSKDAKVKDLVNYVRDNPQKCWADLIPVYREQYYDTYDTVVPVLVKMKDPVVNSVLMRNLDPAKNNELKTLSDIADTSDPEKDPLTFKRMAKLQNTTLNKKLTTKTLPDNIKAMLTINAEKTTKKKVSTKKTTIKKKRSTT